MNQFNENSRVKIPAVLHLCRLGYSYVSLKDSKWNADTNIFTDIFEESIRQINPSVEVDANKIIQDIMIKLDYDDLGRAFYEMMTSQSGIKLIDFDDFENNSFHVVTELRYKNGEEEFRPDISLLINGMPLCFIEVKKPNNREGILNERNRMNSRFTNKKLKRFINISQVLVFSNNMEYDDEDVEPIQGAFYSTTSLTKASFNYFREEDKSVFNVKGFEKSVLEDSNLDGIVDFVLRDTNSTVIKSLPEFETNTRFDTPTNKILSSLFSKKRLAFILRYGIAYVKNNAGLEKHIMRYPQIFATMAIKKYLDSGKKKGVIWHTQGSGKTALAYYNVHFLTDYFQVKGIVAKFYFIVDRIDLLKQAKNEFSKRGLAVNVIDSREDLLNHFRENKATTNKGGNFEITVVNIQKFQDEPNVLQNKDYAINIQRIYFLDEVHRSYNPTGSFLANLIESDRNAILIGLTGTPLILKDRRTTDVFGDYIHKYYYNQSIADGYTVRLIREGIQTNYKTQIEDALKNTEIEKGSIRADLITAHKQFVKPLLEYIINDFVESRIRFGDDSIGGMVICSSAPQARMLFELFNEFYSTDSYYRFAEKNGSYSYAAEPENPYLKINKNFTGLTASLILHDEGNKEDRAYNIEDFKKKSIDLLFVYNMLLTGFDSPRLKKLYLARLIRDHNLLQTLTRVNRPYKDFKYGFVVDFADIRSEFDKTNQEYFKELEKELGDEIQNYSNLFMSAEEIESDIKEIKEKLFCYDTMNLEEFSKQISEIKDRKTILELKQVIEHAKNLYNIIKLSGNTDLLNNLDFTKINSMYNETVNHLSLLNMKASLDDADNTSNLLNSALDDVLFAFRKISEKEMIIADQFKTTFSKTREALSNNFDKMDPQFTTLYDELRRLLGKYNLEEMTQEEMKNGVDELQELFDKAKELNRKNMLLSGKYGNDAKYACVHKRIIEQYGNIKDSALYEMLIDIKTQTDGRLLDNADILHNEAYFTGFITPILVRGLTAKHMDIDEERVKFINSCIVKEYMNEYNGVYL